MNCSRKVLCAALVVAATWLHAAEEKKEKEVPRITVALPFAITAGTNHLTIRGMLLTNAMALRFLHAGNISTEILARGNAAIADKAEPKKVGDTQIEVQVTVPADLTGDVLFVAITPEGETNTNALHVVARGELFTEQEPNGGFRKPNEIMVPQVIRGVAQEANDVDVFRFKGQAHDQLTVRTESVRYGSTLDPVVTLFDAKGHALKSSDDSDGLDAQFTATLPREGEYFISINDAHDRGGPTYPYLLRVGLKR